VAKRGRKPKSEIRENIVELLYFFGEGYGYDLYKKYVKAYGKVSMRSVYYHLRKGIELGTFRIKTIESVAGNYSWGPKAQRVVFALGAQAEPKGNLVKTG